MRSLIPMIDTLVDGVVLLYASLMHNFSDKNFILIIFYSISEG